MKIWSLTNYSIIWSLTETGNMVPALKTYMVPGSGFEPESEELDELSAGLE